MQDSIRGRNIPKKQRSFVKLLKHRLEQRMKIKPRAGALLRPDPLPFTSMTPV
jgi:hypothetical protein